MFISYNRRASSDHVTTVRQKVIDAGRIPWVDTGGIGAGDTLTNEIFSALTMCDTVIPMITKEYTESIWCLRELLFTKCQETKRLIPVLYVGHQALENKTAGKWLWAQISVVKYLQGNDEGMASLVGSLRQEPPPEQ